MKGWPGSKPARGGFRRAPHPGMTCAPYRPVATSIQSIQSTQHQSCPHL